MRGPIRYAVRYGRAVCSSYPEACCQTKATAHLAALADGSVQSTTASAGRRPRGECGWTQVCKTLRSTIRGLVLDLSTRSAQHSFPPRNPSREPASEEDYFRGIISGPHGAKRSLRIDEGISE